MIKQLLDSGVTKQQSQLSEISALTEFKLLTQGDAIEDTHLLQNAFPNSSNSLTLDLQQDDARINKLAEMHEGDIYTEAQIKKICMNYRLRFLDSTHFKGVLPIEVLHALKAKLKSTDKLKYLDNTSQSMYSRNLYVLAPANQFVLSNGRKEKLDRIAEAKRLKAQDPALFVRVEDGTYLFIKEWGNSFSFFRRILGELTKNRFYMNVLLFLTFCVMFIAPVYGWFLLPQLSSIPEPKKFLYTIGLVAYLVITFFWLVFITIDFSHRGAACALFRGMRSENERGFRVDKYFATINNWNSNKKA
jgi:hypothetical protein